RSGKVREEQGKVSSEECALPVFKKKPLVPYVSALELKAEIDRLVPKGVIFPVEHSEWAAPVFALKKKNGNSIYCRLHDRVMHCSCISTHCPQRRGVRKTQLDLAEAHIQEEVKEIQRRC
ncbi:unnamed protein product, partial [Cylicostephanus goldi]